MRERFYAFLDIILRCILEILVILIIKSLRGFDEFRAPVNRVHYLEFDEKLKAERLFELIERRILRVFLYRSVVARQVSDLDGEIDRFAREIGIRPVCRDRYGEFASAALYKTDELFVKLRGIFRAAENERARVILDRKSVV